MSEVSSGLRHVLSNPLVYSFFQQMIGGYKSRELVVREYLRPGPSAHILEIGCGPGDYCEYFGNEINYTGFDLSQSYIDSAKQKFITRTKFQFICADVNDFSLNDSAKFDVCFAAGLLHHLSDDECCKLFRTAQSALKEGGRFVSIDPVFVDEQSRIAKLIISKDRGQNIRTSSAYAKLVNSVFGNSTVAIRHDLLRIPYSHIIMECTR